MRARSLALYLLAGDFWRAVRRQEENLDHVPVALGLGEARHLVCRPAVRGASRPPSAPRRRYAVAANATKQLTLAEAEAHRANCMQVALQASWLFSLRGTRAGGKRPMRAAA